MNTETVEQLPDLNKVRNSAEIVASIDDLLVQILLLLPTTSLVLLKSVSKHFLNLITNPTFSLLRNPNPNPNPNPPLGLYLQRLKEGEIKLQYVPLAPQNPPFQDLKFTNVTDGLFIQQSCNGLLLCTTLESNRDYIFNPKTTQFRELPQLDSVAICGLGLAFDPLRSPDCYSVVSLCVSASNPDDLLQFWVYWSKTRKWRKLLEIPFVMLNFENGVYWNGSIHWIESRVRDPKLMYFNVHQESVHWMPAPSRDQRSSSSTMHFRESCDHLHLTLMEVRTQIQFDVYELKSDYSEWFVKYKVDLTGVAMAYPAMAQMAQFYLYGFSVCSLVRAEIEEDPFLVLEIPGKVIRFNIESKTYEELCDSVVELGEDGRHMPFHARQAFNYIASGSLL